MLRLAGLRPAPPSPKPLAENLTAWNQALEPAGDADAGRRLFFSPVGARCSVCHMHGGRGGNVGPDLTHIGGNTPRERIITSILQPSREIAPDYQPWLITTTDGKTLTGLRTPKAGDSGEEEYIDSEGKMTTLPSEMIEERHAAEKSIMPDNLQATLSIDDLRDLVTFLTTPSK
jgi:putative heme-binding domain-containing protein